MQKLSWAGPLCRVLAVPMLVSLSLACPKPPPARPTGGQRPEVEVVELPPLEEMLRQALREYQHRELAKAQKTLDRALIAGPQHLELRVLRAMVAEASGNAKRAAEAWNEVERILVFKGKLRPFELQPTLYAAAKYYVEADRMERARLFLDELWRRFPGGEWSVKAQLMLAETRAAGHQWSLVLKTCEALRRLRPHHDGNKRCGELEVTARRMLEVGPEPGPDARDWIWEHPLPQGNPLNDLWVGTDGTLVAVGDAGTVLQRLGPRGPPKLVSCGTRWALRSVWGSARDNIYAVGAAGVVAHFDGKAWRVIRDGKPGAPDLWSVFTAGPGLLVAVGDRGTALRLEGGKWRESRPATVTLRGVWGEGPGSAFAVGDGGLLLRLEAGSWRTIPSDSYEDLWDVWGTGKDAVFVVGNRKTVVRIDNGKAKEAVVGRGHFRDLWGFGLNDVWAVGTRGEVIHFDGRVWRSEASGCLVDLFGVAGRSASGLWAVGDGGTMLRRRGRSWAKVCGGLQQDLVALSVEPGGEAAALGEQGMLLQRTRRGGWRRAGSLPLLGRYTAMWRGGGRWIAVGQRGLMVVREGNKKWRRLVTDTPEDLLAVWGYDGGAVAVGTRGTIVRLVGEKVVLDRPATGLDLRDVWGDGKALYAVGNRGTVLRFDGEQWNDVASGVLADLHGVQGFAGGQLVLVGEGGVILSRDRDGARLQQRASPISQTLVDVWGSAPNDIYAVSRRGAIARFDGAGWQVQRSPAACLRAVSGRPGVVLAVGCHGAVVRQAEPSRNTKK